MGKSRKSVPPENAQATAIAMLASMLPEPLQENPFDCNTPEKFSKWLYAAGEVMGICQLTTDRSVNIQVSDKVREQLRARTEEVAPKLIALHNVYIAVFNNRADTAGLAEELHMLIELYADLLRMTAETLRSKASPEVNRMLEESLDMPRW